MTDGAPLQNSPSEPVDVRVVKIVHHGYPRMSGGHKELWMCNWIIS